MKIRLSKISELVSYLKAIRAIRPFEVEMTFHPHNIRVEAIDYSHVAMISFTLGSAFFDDYKVGKSTVLTVPLKEMIAMISSFGATFKYLDMELSEDLVKLELSSVNKKKLRKKFGLQLLSNDDNFVPDIPKFDYNNILVISSENFLTAVKDAHLAEEEIRLKISGDEVLSVTSENTQSIWSEIVPLTSDETESNEYAINYLYEMVEYGSHVSNNVTLKFGPDLPMTLTYNLKHGLLEYILAPMMVGS